MPHDDTSRIRSDVLALLGSDGEDWHPTPSTDLSQKGKGGNHSGVLSRPTDGSSACIGTHATLVNTASVVVKLLVMVATILYCSEKDIFRTTASQGEKITDTSSIRNHHPCLTSLSPEGWSKR